MIIIESDIHAIEGNPNGFGAGEWIPALTITYTIKSAGATVMTGKFLPMVAKDGPHYGAQIFLPFGKYTLTYHISPPDSAALARHSDPVTGVEPWWKPFDVSWPLDFKGAKK